MNFCSAGRKRVLRSTKMLPIALPKIASPASPSPKKSTPRDFASSSKITRGTPHNFLANYSRPMLENGNSISPASVLSKNVDVPLVSTRATTCHISIRFPRGHTNGDRILRCFTNLNPNQNRVWTTSQTFEAIGPQFAKSIGLPRPRSANLLARGVRSIASALRIPGAHRPPYDEFMHRCHNAMKEDANFRESCPKQRWEFPPGSSWIVFTDCVSHAVLEGQYALEQTFLISRQAMVEPEKSPIAILERIAGYPLSN